MIWDVMPYLRHDLGWTKSKTEWRIRWPQLWHITWISCLLQARYKAIIWIARNAVQPICRVWIVSTIQGHLPKTFNNELTHLMNSLLMTVIRQPSCKPESISPEGSLPSYLRCQDSSILFMLCKTLSMMLPNTKYYECANQRCRPKNKKDINFVLCIAWNMRTFCCSFVVKVILSSGCMWYI